VTDGHFALTLVDHYGIEHLILDHDGYHPVTAARPAIRRATEPK
jgi:hypothetical protein